MKSKHLKIMKELYNNYLDKTLPFELYDDPKELTFIKELLQMGILNPQRYQTPDQKNSLAQIIASDARRAISENPKLKASLEKEGFFDDEKKVIKHEYITTVKSNPVFTPEGEKYYFDYVNKSWYRRMKEKWWIELLIDIFAIIGFFTSIILAYMKIFNNQQ